MVGLAERREKYRVIKPQCYREPHDTAVDVCRTRRKKHAGAEWYDQQRTREKCPSAIYVSEFCKPARLSTWQVTVPLVGGRKMQGRKYANRARGFGYPPQPRRLSGFYRPFQPFRMTCPVSTLALFNRLWTSSSSRTGSRSVKAPRKMSVLNSETVAAFGGAVEGDGSVAVRRQEFALEIDELEVEVGTEQEVA